MLKICFHGPGSVPDERLAFAVIAARKDDKWLWVRHRERDTWEIPGGHREPGEAIEAAARRELYEETGARSFALSPVCAYSVQRGKEESFGMLYIAQVEELGPLPESEIAEVKVFDEMPEELTYPEIQPRLWERVSGAAIAAKSRGVV